MSKDESIPVMYSVESGRALSMAYLEGKDQAVCVST